MVQQLDRFNLPEPPDKKDSRGFTSEDYKKQEQIFKFNLAPETTTPIYAPTTGELLYDPNIVKRQTGALGLSYNLNNQQEEQYLPGLYQPTSQRIANFVPTLLANIVGEAAHIASAVPDMVDLVATGTGLTNEPIFGWYDNIESFKNKVIDEYVPTYMTKEYAEGNLSFWESLGHAEFYNKELAPTLGFLVGAYGTGYAASALKLGTRAVNLGVNINKTLSNSKKITDGTRLANLTNKADFFAQVATQTMYESIAEANHVRMEMLEYYEPLIKKGEVTANQVNERINAAAGRTFLANAALLSFTNAVGVGILNKIFPSLKPSARTALDKGPFSRMWDKTGLLVSDPVRFVGKEFTWKVAKGTALGIGTEAFEEGSQSIFSDTYKQLAKSDRISQMGFNIMDDMSAFAINLSGQLGTTEFNKAIILGGIIGGMAGGIGNTREYLGDVKKAEKIRTNLQDQWNNNVNVLREVSITDENGQIVFDEQGNPQINITKLKSAISRNIENTADLQVLEKLLEEGETEKAQGFFMSRMMAPMIHQYVDHPQGKEFLMANLRNALIQNGREEAVEALPKEIEDAVGKYYDHYKAAYEEISPEVGNYLRSRVSIIGNQTKLSKLLKLKNRYRPGLKQDITEEEKAEFKTQKEMFIKNVSYAATNAATRRNILKEEIEELDNVIQQLESELETAESKETKDLVKVKIEARKDTRAEKLQHKAIVESELSSLFSPEFYNREFSKFLDIDKNFEYLTQYEAEIQKTIDALERDAKANGYEFGPADSTEILESPRSNDVRDRLKESVYFRKGNDFYTLIKSPQGISFMAKVNKDGSIDSNMKPVYLAVAEDVGYFDGMTMLSKEEKDKIIQVYNIKSQVTALSEVLNEEQNKENTNLSELQNQLSEVNRILNNVRNKLSYRKSRIAELRQNPTEENLQKIQEYAEDIATFTEQVIELKAIKEQLQVALGTTTEVGSQYKQILNAIDAYVTQYGNLTTLDVIEGMEVPPITQGVINNFFSLDEVQSVFGKVENPPVDFESYNLWQEHINQLRENFKQTSKQIKELEKTIKNTKKGIVNAILYNLTGLSKTADIPLSAIAEFIQNNVPNGQALVELLNVYIANPLNVDTAFETNINKDAEYYDQLISGLDIDNLSSQFFTAFTDLFTSPDIVNQIVESLNNLSAFNKSKIELDQSIGQIEDAFTRFLNLQEQLDNLQTEIEYTNDFVANLNSIIAKVSEYVNQIGTQGYIIDRNTQTNTEPDVDQSTDALTSEREAFGLRKSNLITTINGITKIVNGRVQYDQNGMPILNEEEETYPESIAANTWINNQDATTFAKNYKMRIASAAQLEQIFANTDQTVPVTDDTALYVVPVDNAGNPVRQDGYIVYFGLPNVSTTFPSEGRSTLNEDYVINEVFEIVDDVVEFNNTKYDLKSAEDYAIVLAEANKTLQNRYSNYRTELQQRAQAGETILLEPEGLSKGVAVVNRVLNKDTGEIETIYRAANTLNNIKNILIAYKSIIKNPVTGFKDPTIPGSVIAYMADGKAVTLNTRKLNDAEVDTAIKLLGYLGYSKNLQDTIDYNGQAMSILPTNKQNGLIDLLMPWGISLSEEGNIRNQNILITGKGLNNRKLTYMRNGNITNIDLQSIVSINNDGSLEVNRDNPQVLELIEFLKTKSHNVNGKALNNPMFANSFAMPTDINIKTDKVTLGKEYKSYEAYVLDNTVTHLVPDNSNAPQFLNRYVILPQTLPARPKAQAPKQKAPTVTPQQTQNAGAKIQKANTSVFGADANINPTSVPKSNNGIQGSIEVNEGSKKTLGNFNLSSEGVFTTLGSRTFEVDENGNIIKEINPDSTTAKIFKSLNYYMKTLDPNLSTFNFEKIQVDMGVNMDMGITFSVDPIKEETTPTPPETPPVEQEEETQCGTGSGKPASKSKKQGAKTKRKSSK